MKPLVSPSLTNVYVWKLCQLEHFTARQLVYKKEQSKIVFMQFNMILMIFQLKKIYIS